MLLYDLAGADDRRFSPYCWRAKMALAHKGLPFETVATGFTQIAAIGDGSHRTVPVLIDGERQIHESFVIAEYLEDLFADRPSLFGGAGGRAAARLIDGYATSLLVQIGRMVTLDIEAILRPEDRGYFRATREKRFGKPLEEVVAGREDRLAGFRESLLPLRLMLRHQPFVGGAGANYADHILFGTLQWPRVVSSFRLLPEDDPVAVWFERCLDLYDGLGRAQAAA